MGSLLRPEYLLRAREALADGRMGRAEFKKYEDRAVDEAVELQEEAGLPVLTDGEMRRASFQSQMAAAVEGFGDPDLDAFLWGRWQGSEELGDLTVERPEGLAVTSRLRRRRSLSAEEFTYVRGLTDRLPKVTLPSPTLFANFWSPRASSDAYPELADFLEDVARVLREEVSELERLGCEYIQLDAPHYPLLVDEEARGFYEVRGADPEEWLARSVALENHVMDAAPSLTWGLHVCRGNQDSRWLVSGGYGPLAESVLARTRAGRLLLEYDDERSGSFEPLGAVPDEKMVVLGLVTTKTARPETAEALEERVREAAAHHPLDRLGLSPQCGFGTSVVGNRISPATQARKLITVTEAASRIWPDAITT